jgi:DNA-binding NarL/FixJ family response regulator
MQTERVVVSETAVALDPRAGLSFLSEPVPASGATSRATVGALFDGAVEIVEVFRVDTTYRVVGRWRTGAPRRRLSPQERRVLARLAGGRSQKEIGYDLGVGLTTVSEHLRVALDKLGLRCWETAVIAVAALERTALDVMRAEPPRTDGEDPSAFIAKVELDGTLLGALTVAEREVALLAVDGCSNAEIGVRRRSSPRTVANQVASAFRKLRAHGRLELLRRLMVEPSFGAP